MRVSVVPVAQLGASELARWAEIQASTPAFDSPYFAPEFVRCAGEVREGVEVAVLEDGAGIFGFFPFERGRGNVGYPVARSYSDFQAVIARAGAEWDGAAVVRGCGLAAWRFDHLLVSQLALRPFHWSEAPSPYVDLSSGFEGYRAERKRAGSREIDQILYKARKAERRAGPLRFEFHTPDGRVVDALLAWKAAQLRATGQPEHVSLPWVRRFLDRIRAERRPAFSGVVSALYAGETLVAAHLGMRTPTVLHWWLPAFDPAQGALSPGQLSFLEVARAAAADGVKRVDLGKGTEPYKTRLMSGSIMVAEGAIHLSPPVGAMWRTRYRAMEWARRSPLRGMLREPARWLRRVMAARNG